MKQFKPMLASPVDWDKVTWPKYIARKLDGIRCLIIDGVAMSRSLKPIPNQHIQDTVSHLEGLDGELICGEPNDINVYRTSNSGIMSRDGKPDFMFHVFDMWDMNAPWVDRFDQLLDIKHERVQIVPHIRVHGPVEAQELTDLFISEGYEGSMLRDPKGHYKNGRATSKEGYLLKVKEWEDSEMTVYAMIERMQNQNPATINELGRTSRSLAKAGLVPSGTMGTLIGTDVHDGRTVEVGTGFSDEERARFWGLRDSLGLVPMVKYKRMKSTGGYDKPRHASYVGLRSALDI